MTQKDKIIQEQRHKIAELKEELKLIVESCQLCRFCKYIDADCSPRTPSCKPEWRGVKE